MSFRVMWDNLLDNMEELPADATLVLSYSLRDDRPATATDQIVYPDGAQVGFYQ